jgi:uncharacterized Zn-finger protein
MKAPFGFGLRFFLRVLLPGFVLTCALLPALIPLLDLLQANIPAILAITPATLLLGWLCTVLDMPIYMLFEGRRFWPPGIREACRLREQSRLDRVRDRAFQGASERVRREAATDLRRSFPFDADGTFTAEAPTRLGNLIFAYEKYSLRVYGFDATFLWYRLWLTIDKDRREEIDNQQAMADSTIYVVACLIVAALLCLVYAVLKGIGLRFVPERVSALVFLAGAVALVGLAFGLYRISLHVHDNFGKTFRSVFDIFLPQLSFPNVERHVDRMLSLGQIDVQQMRARNRMIMDFMLSSRVTVPGSANRRVWVDNWNQSVPAPQAPSAGNDGHGWIATGQTVWCSGDRNNTHPRVFLRTGDGDPVQCPYCNRWLALATVAADKNFSS